MRVRGGGGGAEPLETFALDRPCARHTQRHICTLLRPVRPDQIAGRDRRHLDPEIDSIEQRAGYPRLIVGAATLAGRQR
jgi:hypothetical protein